MAEPARKLPEEDRPDIYPQRPNLRPIEGGGKGDGVPRGNLRAAEEQLGNARSEGGLYNQGGDTPNLQEAEQNPEDLDDDEDRLGNGYTEDENSSRRRRRRFKLTRRKAAAAGLGGAGLISVIIGLTSVSQGPLEF